MTCKCKDSVSCRCNITIPFQRVEARRVLVLQRGGNIVVAKTGMTLEQVRQRHLGQTYASPIVEPVAMKEIFLTEGEGM